MKKLLLASVSVAALFAMPAFAQSNTSTVDQNGTDLGAIVTQSGSSNGSTVTQTGSGNDADVQMGSIRTRQSLNGLRRLGRARAERAEQEPRTIAPLPYVAMELDLRGNRAAEVEPALERYLDEAYRSGLPMVRIIHGKGTGALRQVVREALKLSPVVQRQESAPANEGGEGATVAYLRAN